MKSKSIISVPLTDHFIDYLVDYLLTYSAKTQVPLSRLAIIFGGHRPSLFLRKALVKRLGRAMISPKILTVDEWMEYILIQTGHYRKRLDPMDHAYVIYRIVQKHLPHLLKGRDSFAHFWPWAKEIAAFLDATDLQALPSGSFELISKHAHLGYDVPKDINDLLLDLSTLRIFYHDHLQEHGVSTKGFDYLVASKAILELQHDEWDHVVFANFFYLHQTELTIIQHMVDKNKAILMLQGDERRWPALKRIGQAFDTSIVEGEEIKATQFDLAILTATDRHAQAALIAEILTKADNLDNTVIVLPHADFVLPLLSALPPQIKDFNISMGYPLKRSNVYAFLELIIAVQHSLRNGKVYTRDYVKLLHYPSLWPNGDNGVQTLKIILAVASDALMGRWQSSLSGVLFINPHELEQDLNIKEEIRRRCADLNLPCSDEEINKQWANWHEMVYDTWLRANCFSSLGQTLDKWLRWYKSYFPHEINPFTQAALKTLDALILRYQELQCASQSFLHHDLFNLFLTALGEEIVHLSGSPLRGLQILGLLQTRTLNFEHVIVADCHEGQLPQMNLYEPLIPRDVMMLLSLDQVGLEDQIQRYNFMRLIAAAKKVTLIYNDHKDLTRSRYVEELIWEKESKSGHIHHDNGGSAMFGGQLMIKEKVAYKTPAILAYLKTMRFSASSLNMYARNPYEFYLNYVLGLREEDDALDDPDGRIFGQFLHAFLEKIFTPWVLRKPQWDNDFIKEAMVTFNLMFNQIFEQKGRGDSFMLKAIMSTRLKRFLEAEIRRAKHIKHILFIEKKFQDRLLVGEWDVALTYRMDRVDVMEDNSIIVMDYKTGQDEPLPRTYDSWSQMGSCQLPLYVDFLSRQFPQQQVNAALVGLRTNELKYFIKDNKSLPLNLIIEGHRRLLKDLLSDLFDKDKPFLEGPYDTKR